MIRARGRVAFRSRSALARSAFPSRHVRRRTDASRRCGQTSPHGLTLRLRSGRGAGIPTIDEESRAMNRFSRHFILGLTVVAAGSAMADVTFYESENFGGRQISGNQSMPNFRALDFNDRARSAIVEGGPGRSAWEPISTTTARSFARGRYPSPRRVVEEDQFRTAGFAVGRTNAGSGQCQCRCRCQRQCRRRLSRCDPQGGSYSSSPRISAGANSRSTNPTPISADRTPASGSNRRSWKAARGRFAPIPISAAIVESSCRVAIRTSVVSAVISARFDRPTIGAAECRATECAVAPARRCIPDPI